MIALDRLLDDYAREVQDRSPFEWQAREAITKHVDAELRRLARFVVQRESPWSGLMTDGQMERLMEAFRGEKGARV